MTDVKERYSWVEAEAFGPNWEKIASSLLAIQVGLNDYLIGESSGGKNKRYRFDDIDVVVTLPDNISTSFNSSMTDNRYAEVRVRFPNKMIAKLLPVLDMYGYKTVDHPAVNTDINYTVVEMSPASKNNMLWMLMDIFKIATRQEKFIEDIYRTWK